MKKLWIFSICLLTLWVLWGCTPTADVPNHTPTDTTAQPSHTNEASTQAIESEAVTTQVTEDTTTQTTEDTTSQAVQDTTASEETTAKVEPISVTLVFQTAYTGIEPTYPDLVVTWEALRDETVTLPSPQKPQHTFEGWYIDHERTTPFDPNTLPPTDVLVLYPHFVPNADFEGYRITVTLADNTKEGLVHQSGALSQTIKSVQDFEPVVFACDIMGYGAQYQIGGVTYYQNTLTLPPIYTDTDIVVSLGYVTGELPIVDIQTSSGQGQEGIVSKVEYVPMTFSLTNTQDTLTAISGGIRLRGKSTAEYEKKPFRIKFDQKQSLFGHEKAKSWVLLADYLDPSTLHNQIALNIAGTSEHFAFSPTAHKVNVYMDGEFLGLYTLCEQIQEQAGRLDLEQVITPDMSDLSQYNFYVCMNEYAPEEPGALEGETYFFIPTCGRYFELKYPLKEDFPSEAQFQNFFAQLENYYWDLTDTFMYGNIRSLKNTVNLDSLIDYMIIDQIMGERDHVWKSFYMYHTVTSSDKNLCGKLNFGPVWDYDFCLFAPWTGEPNVYYEVDNKLEYSNIFFKGVAENATLMRQVEKRYRDHFSGVLGEQIKALQVYQKNMATSLSLNQSLWYNGIDKNLTRNNLTFFKSYLVQRKGYLDEMWK